MRTALRTALIALLSVMLGAPLVTGNPRSVAVAGGTIPAQIWHDFMAVALRGLPPTDFAAPGPFETVGAR